MKIHKRLNFFWQSTFQQFFKLPRDFPKNYNSDFILLYILEERIETKFETCNSMIIIDKKHIKISFLCSKKMYSDLSYSETSISITKSSCSTNSFSPKCIFLILPFRELVIVLSIFIASKIKSGVPTSIGIFSSTNILDN